MLSFPSLKVETLVRVGGQPLRPSPRVADTVAGMVASILPGTVPGIPMAIRTVGRRHRTRRRTPLPAHTENPWQTNSFAAG